MTTAPLYALSLSLAQVWEEAADVLDGEPVNVDQVFALEQLEAKLAELEGTLAQKALNIGALIKNLEAEADMIATEEANLKARRMAAERKAAWLKEYLQGNMEPGMRLSNGRVALSWRRSSAVEVTIPAEQLPTVFQRIKTTVEPDKAKIGEYFTANPKAVIAGCALVARHNLQIK